MRAFTIAVTLALLATGCSGGGDTGAETGANADTTSDTDLFGNEVPEGQDWSGVGDPAFVDASTSSTATAGESANEAQVPIECLGSTTTATAPEGAPPGVDPEHPFGQPENDFPLEVNVRPEKGDRGSLVRVTAVAVGTPNALAVLVTSFRDRKHHGMTDAKVTDAAGRAVFEGPIPETAPVGSARINISVSTGDERSAIESVEFFVTGPGCP